MNQLNTTDRDPLRLQRRRAISASLVGTAIEWYDYALYGAAASVVIGPLFFSSAGSSAASIAAFATFAVGFVARPVGGAVIGHLGDRFGRRPAMLLSVILMGIATVGIGLLPTAQTWGAWSIGLLVFLRLVQGFGAGAELTGAMTLVAEYVEPKKRGLYTSLILSTPPLGIALATICFFGVSLLGDEALLGWAWRIPFLISALLFLVALYIRNKLEETPEYAQAMNQARQRAGAQKLPLREVFESHWRRVVLGFFAITGHNATNYILAVFSLSLMVGSGMARSEALLAGDPRLAGLGAAHSSRRLASRQIWFCPHLGSRKHCRFTAGIPHLPDALHGSIHPRILGHRAGLWPGHSVHLRSPRCVFDRTFPRHRAL